MINILEFIDSLLPQNLLDIYFLELPKGKSGVLIEETGINGQIHSFKGFDGVISSNIQFFARVAPTDGKYKEIERLLKRFYMVVKDNEGVEQDGVKLLYVDEFRMTPIMRDEQHNYVFSLTFPITYKESDLNGIK